jgi:dienelactone hydrolase
MQQPGGGAEGAALVYGSGTALGLTHRRRTGRRATLEATAEVLLFHHAQGLTAGCLSFADDLRAAGHVVHTPDLYDGNTFSHLGDGVDYAQKVVGIDTILDRARRAAEGVPNEVVYAGFSLGALSAQMLAQTRPGAKGALLLHGCEPANVFDTPWPEGVPLQVHTMDADEWVELDTARELVASVQGAELFLYPGDGHLFADNSLSDYDEGAAALLKERVHSFLDKVD